MVKRALVTDTTDITPILLDYTKVGKLPDLSAAEVVPFLKARLKWRIVTVRLLHSSQSIR
jgi:tyrosinase